MPSFAPKRFVCLAIAAVAVLGCQSKKTSIPSEDRTISGTATTGPTTRAATRPARVPRPKKPAMEHDRFTFDAAELRRGWFSHAVFSDDRGGIIVQRPDEDFPFVGKWQSDTIKPPFAFTELLPSWNVNVPALADTGVRFDVRVRDAASGTWSPWLYMGYWGRVLRDHREISFDGGKVDVDTLELSKPADAYEVRATLQIFNTQSNAVDASPVVRSLNVVASRVATDDSSEPASKPTWSPVDLPVPFRAQGVEAESIRHSVCSPTSVSMVMEWAGTKRATAENCSAIWDDDNAMFGNWNRAVQLAGSLGHEAYLERFSTMDQARATISAGQPIIASIRFRAGEFPSNLQKSTAGHLIVLKGIDANGDIIVNDPASKDRGEHIVYKADELAGAWIGSTGGVGYIIKKKP